MKMVIGDQTQQILHAGQKVMHGLNKIFQRWFLGILREFKLRKIHLLFVGSHAATCRQPLPPQNGSVDDRRGTNDGYMVNYYCNPGFLPDVPMIAICTTVNGSWVPEPADLVCTKQLHNVPGNCSNCIMAEVIESSL